MARIALTSLIVLAISFVLFPGSRLETAMDHMSPFGLTGDGTIKLVDVQTGERLSIVYRNSDGSYGDSSLAAVDHTLRCHGKKEVYPISLKLIELVDHIQDHFGAAEVSFVSGYRSPEYNEFLRRKIRRVAHDSLHMKGVAMDIKINGINKAELAKYARTLRAGGVGLYADSTFIHVDVGPVRTW